MFCGLRRWVNKPINSLEAIFRSWIPGTRVTADEVTALTDRLLDAGRPRAAFNALHLAWDGVETSRLRRLLKGIVAGSPEPDGSIKLGAYDVCRAIESLNKRAGVARDEMADLEFVCSDLLEFVDYGVLNIERRIAEDPSYFVWLVALVYKRKDGRADPDGWPVSNPKNKADFGQLAFSVLGVGFVASLRRLMPAEGPRTRKRASAVGSPAGTLSRATSSWVAAAAEAWQA